MPIMASLVTAGHHLSRPNEECHEVSDAISDLARRGCVCVCVAQDLWILLTRSQPFPARATANEFS